VLAGHVGVPTEKARLVFFQLSGRGAVELGWFAFVAPDPSPVDWLPFGQEVELPTTLDDGTPCAKANGALKGQT
jgi:hypothetical protein